MGKWNFTKYAVTILFICCHIGCSGQKISIEKIKEFVPESAISSEIRVYLGDLNLDGIEDAILRFKILDEPIENEHFYILIGKNDGTIKLHRNDIFRFDNKNGMVFDSVIISKDSDFTVKYCGKENTYGSYRKIKFKYHADEAGRDYWILDRDEELFQHKIFAPAPQKPLIATKNDMRGIGGEYFGNIKENLYDVLIRMKIKNHIPDSAYECRAFLGDLNRDSYDDIVLRFKLRNESEYRENIHLFIGQNNGKYKLVAKNDFLELDGVDGTVFDNIVIKNGYFSLEYRGYGNTGGSYDIITFKYSETDKNWLLHRVGSKFVHRYFTEGEPRENIRTQKDFGKILFEDYR